MQLPTVTFKDVEPGEFFLTSLDDGPFMLYHRLESGLSECLDTYIGTRHGAHQFSRESTDTVYFGTNQKVLKFKYEVQLGA